MLVDLEKAHEWWKIILGQKNFSDADIFADILLQICLLTWELKTWILLNIFSDWVFFDCHTLSLPFWPFMHHFLELVDEIEKEKKEEDKA